MSWQSWLSERASARDAAGLRRSLRPRAADESRIDLAGNDYLGLSRHPRVVAAAADAVHTWGTGAGAAWLVTGTLTLHEELQRELSDYLGQSSALVFSTGYHANLSVISALADAETLVISDAHVHASLIDGMRLAKAEVRVVPHNDVGAVADALAATTRTRALVVVESVYSVLGDQAPLCDLATLCEHHGALLIVDEAHGVGVLGEGRGLVHSLGLAGLPHVIVTATLSKALGAQGGVVLAPSSVREHLINTARPFIFDTALAPASAAAAQAALGVLREHPELTATVHQRVADLAARLEVVPPSGAVLSVPMGSPQQAIAAQAQLFDLGFRVGCFRPPSVPDGVSRLRITCNAGVPEDRWQRAVSAVESVVAS